MCVLIYTWLVLCCNGVLAKMDDYFVGRVIGSSSKVGLGRPITLSPPAVTSVARKHAWGTPQAKPEKRLHTGRKISLLCFCNVIAKAKRSHGMPVTSVNKFASWVNTMPEKHGTLEI